MAHWFYSIRSKSFHFFSLSSLQYTVQYFTDVLASTASILHLFIISLNLPMYCTSWPLFHRCSGLYSLYPPPVYHLLGPTYVLHDLYFLDVLASTASILHLCIISLDLPMYFMTSILQMFWPLRLLSSTCVSSPWIGTGLSPTPSPTPSRWATGEKSAKFR